MLDMKLDSGKFVIDDNNETHVDGIIEDEIMKGFKENEDNKDKQKPNLDVKD